MTNKEYAAQLLVEASNILQDESAGQNGFGRRVSDENFDRYLDKKHNLLRRIDKFEKLGYGNHPKADELRAGVRRMNDNMIIATRNLHKYDTGQTKRGSYLHFDNDPREAAKASRDYAARSVKWKKHINRELHDRINKRGERAKSNNESAVLDSLYNSLALCESAEEAAYILKSINAIEKGY